MKCARCDDDRWVCEGHGERPWGNSPAAGMLCPDCNRSNPPQMPPGFTIEVDADDDGTLRN